MKTCPKCNGKYFDDDEYCSECNIQLIDNNEYNETIKRSPADKITILNEMQENIKSIYSLIFKDLECLFYQLV